MKIEKVELTRANLTTEECNSIDKTIEILESILTAMDDNDNYYAVCADEFRFTAQEISETIQDLKYYEDLTELE